MLFKGLRIRLTGSEKRARAQSRTNEFGTLWNISCSRYRCSCSHFSERCKKDFFWLNDVFVQPRVFLNDSDGSSRTSASLLRHFRISRRRNSRWSHDTDGRFELFFHFVVSPRSHSARWFELRHRWRGLRVGLGHREAHKKCREIICQGEIIYSQQQLHNSIWPWCFNKKYRFISINSAKLSKCILAQEIGHLG